MLLGETPIVYSAAKYEQKISEAPASITIISADQIRKYGYRTFAQVLQSVPGLFATYDRNYDYLGVRGFNRPGDYNSFCSWMVTA
jgi:iron complex outermembrane receptor protein